MKTEPKQLIRSFETRRRHVVLEFDTDGIGFLESVAELRRHLGRQGEAPCGRGRAVSRNATALQDLR